MLESRTDREGRTYANIRLRAPASPELPGYRPPSLWLSLPYRFSFVTGRVGDTLADTGPLLEEPVRSRHARNGGGRSARCYHLSVKTISRSAGRSATAAAAYRACAQIEDENNGALHDYRRKQGLESETLITPDNAPEWAQDRQALWSEAEKAEKRKNATVAREVVLALPDDMTPEQRKALATEFAREIVERHGCAADVCIHQPGKDGDQRNYHAHVMFSTRRMDSEGFTEKTRELDDRKTGPQIVKAWRERFAELQNTHLERAGLDGQVDHRSHKDRDIEQLPTQHEGPKVTALRRRGVLTERAKENDARRQSNAEIIDFPRRKEALEAQAKKDRFAGQSDKDIKKAFIQLYEEVESKADHRIVKFSLAVSERQRKLRAKQKAHKSTDPKPPAIWRTPRAMREWREKKTEFNQKQKRMQRRERQLEAVALRVNQYAEGNQRKEIKQRRIEAELERRDPQLFTKYVEIHMAEQARKAEAEKQAAERARQEEARKAAEAKARARERMRKTRDKDDGLEL